MTPAAIASKLWNYRNVLRDDGMSYGDYVEQFTYLQFLKMADERTRPLWTMPTSGAHKQPSAVPAGFDWPNLLKRDGDELFDRYRHTLEDLGIAPAGIA
jgi:type I restriction enzyme M protein